MDINKRYCQNRQRKCKKTLVPPLSNKRKNVSPSEEERQFKLRRFVEDVGKYLSEKESCPGQEAKRETPMKICKAVKKVSIPTTMVSKRLFQHAGLQTKLCTRGVTTREMTARLDENMHRIISLTNGIKSNQPCQCTQHCKGKTNQQAGSESVESEEKSRNTSILRPLQPRSSPGFEDSPPTLRSPVTAATGGVGVATSSGDARNAKSMSELDKELYPLFARVVSVSCTQTKSKLFNNQSYVSALKRKLLEDYRSGMDKDVQELSCPGKSVKATSSVGTSPFPSSVVSQSSYHKESTFKLAPAKPPVQSALQFLEETIGPSSTSSRQMCPSPPIQPRNRCRRQPAASLLSPPVVGHHMPVGRHYMPMGGHLRPTGGHHRPVGGHQRPVGGHHRSQRVFAHVPKASRYVHEPFPSTSPSLTPLLNLESNIFDGSGDGFNFNRVNSFLPTIEEEEVSPDFRFYPTRIF